MNYKYLPALRDCLNGTNPTESGHLVVHYQPQVKLNPEFHTDIVGFEALVRWWHPTVGLVMPDLFLPLVDLGDLNGLLAERVVNIALDDLMSLFGPEPEVTVSINLSARNLMDRALPQMLHRALDRRGLPRSALVAELTEQQPIADHLLAREIIDEIRRNGIGMSLDDYGSGYCSLAYVRDFKFDEIKLDGSFANKLGTDRRTDVVIEHCVDLADDFGMRVVAEKIEDLDTLIHFAQLGVDIGQGYLIARPMPVPELTNWLDARFDARFDAHTVVKGGITLP